MLQMFSKKRILLLILVVLSLTIGIANSMSECSQNSLIEEVIVCKNVENINDLRNVKPADWKQLKIINKKVKTLEWNETPEDIINLENLDVSQVGELILAENGNDNLPNLKTLNVSNCKIDSLKNTIFSSANKLINLDASWNFFTSLSVNNYSSLEVANFSHNDIQLINSDKVLQNLKILHLDFNQLKNIVLHEYRQLNVLTMGDNLIEKLNADSFKNLELMEELVITYCPLSYIGDRSFESMAELKKLNLSSNSLEQLSADVFAGLNRLIQLDLNSNNIKILAHLQFQYLAKLQYLDLSRNSLKFLNSTNFSNLASLRKLLLYENNIKEISSNTFANLVSLDTLDLSYNEIEHFDRDEFGSHILPRLRKLLLKSNNIKSLHPLAFASIPFLQYLSLGFNQLTSLDVRMFAPMRRLEKLHLGNNLIETILSDVLESLTDVQELLLDKNRLSFLSNSNATFEKLEKVSLEGNPWQCPCWNEMSQWLEDRKVSYVRPQSPYFKGQRPLCVVTPVDFCVKNLHLVKEHKIEEIYNNGFN